MTTRKKLNYFDIEMLNQFLWQSVKQGISEKFKKSVCYNRIMKIKKENRFSEYPSGEPIKQRFVITFEDGSKKIHWHSDIKCSEKCPVKRPNE